MSDYTLYYTPGACSLSPHIALREAGASFDLERVDLRNKKLATEGAGDWFTINAKGYVPALKLPDGEILTEGAVIISYIADQFPDARLAPKYGTLDRYRLNETVHFIATELHKAIAPLYNVLISSEHKTQLIERTHKRLETLAAILDGRQYLHGDAFTIADNYAYYALRGWQRALNLEVRSNRLLEYYDRLSERPSIAAALAAEGIKP